MQLGAVPTAASVRLEYGDAFLTIGGATEKSAGVMTAAHAKSLADLHVAVRNLRDQPSTALVVAPDPELAIYDEPIELVPEHVSRIRMLEQTIVTMEELLRLHNDRLDQQKSAMRDLAMRIDFIEQNALSGVITEVVES